MGLRKETRCQSFPSPIQCCLLVYRAMTELVVEQIVYCCPISYISVTIPISRGSKLMLLTANSVPFIRINFRWLASGGLAAIGLASLVSVFGLAGNAQSATASNAKSPLGINLVEMNYYNPEQPFLNIFKTSGVSRSTPSGWSTHSLMDFNTGEAAYLQLDANGYPTTLKASSADPHSPQLFTSVGVLLERELPNSNGGSGLPYRAGRYVVLYDGQGTLEYRSDAALVSSSAGRDIINVRTPTGGGIDLRITATDPNHTGNYIHNIRVVKAEEESLLVAGNVFEPAFLSLLQNFHVVRAMQWLGIDSAGGLLTNWADRPVPSDAGWGGNGVPLEAVLQLCNSVGADCWLNVPHKANNDYITQMAVLAHANLATSQKVYIEFSNEVWNGIYAQAGYAAAQGQAQWPNAGVIPFAYNRSWYGMRTAQMCDIWKSVWGADSSRVVCVLGAQSGNSGTATQALDCPLWTGSGNAPCSNHKIDAIAVAPYFGFFQIQKSSLAAVDGGHAQLFQEIGNILPQVAKAEVQDKTSLASYNLPIIAYEGGQSLVSNDPAVLSLYIAANRDPRMDAAYTTAFKDWKANGGQIYVVFADIYKPSQYGEWGALESFLDTVSPLSNAPPKWQAIQNFISGNPCWWPGCAGTIGTGGATPTAPILSVK